MTAKQRAEAWLEQYLADRKAELEMDTADALAQLAAEFTDFGADEVLQDGTEASCFEEADLVAVAREKYPIHLNMVTALLANRWSDGGLPATSIWYTA